METTAPTRFHALIDSRTELLALEGERLILTQRFRDFADTIGLGFVGGCNVSQYKLPCRDTLQRKPIIQQQFGKGHGNIRHEFVDPTREHEDPKRPSFRRRDDAYEPEETVFSVLNAIVSRQCSLFGRWADAPKDDTPEQAKIRAEWSSILSDWRDLAVRTQLALPYRESKWR